MAGNQRYYDRHRRLGRLPTLIRPGIALECGRSRMPHGFGPAQATAFREKSRIADMGLLVLCEFRPSHRTGYGRKARPAN
jgi:hypothetical protein